MFNLGTQSLFPPGCLTIIAVFSQHTCFLQWGAAPNVVLYKPGAWAAEDICTTLCSICWTDKMKFGLSVAFFFLLVVSTVTAKGKTGTAIILINQYLSHWWLYLLFEWNLLQWPWHNANICVLLSVLLLLTYFFRVIWLPLVYTF